MDNIHLYVWLGTCDLTYYDGIFVALSANKDIVDSIINTYQKFIDFLKPYPACKLTFFEISPYSIIDLNKSRKHSDPKSFKKDEEDILANIIKVNEHIRHINTSLNTFSPIFSSPGRKVHVNYCHHLASVVCRLSSVVCSLSSVVCRL